MNTNLSIYNLDHEQFFKAVLKNDNKVISNTYITKFEIQQTCDYVHVFTFFNSQNFNSVYTVDEVDICDGSKTLSAYRKVLPAKTNKWYFPDSTNIYKFKYVKSTSTLQIVFKSNKDVKYLYFNVPAFRFINMYMAESKGKYFVRQIKGNFRCSKVDL